jgi:hypothetical protein
VATVEPNVVLEKTPTEAQVSGGLTWNPQPASPAVNVSEQQWDRVYRHVGRIKRPTARWENFAWAMVGLFVAAVVAFIAWLFRPETARKDTVPEAAAYIALAVFAIVLVVLAAMAQKGQVDQLERDKSDVMEEMCDLHMPLSELTKEGDELVR